MADTVIIAILALVTSCQARPYLVQSPMSTEIVSGGTAEFTCGVRGRSTSETIIWFVAIVDNDAYWDIPVSPDASQTDVDGFVYDVEYSPDSDGEYYRLTVSEVMVPLKLTCVFTSIVDGMPSRTLLSEWVSLTLIYSSSTTSLPSSPRSREHITMIKLDPTTTSQNDSTITDMSSVAAIAGGIGCCTVIIIFLIGVTLYLRIRHGYCYTCKINKTSKSDIVVPSKTLHSIGTANDGFMDAINDYEGNPISTSYALSNGKLSTHALPKERKSTPGEMPTYSLPGKKKSTLAEMPTYALPEKRQSTPAIMPTYALQNERQSSPSEIPTYALPNKRQSSPGEIPTHGLSDNVSQNDSTENPPTYAIPDKTRNKATAGEMPTYALPNKRQSTAVNKTPDCGKYLATVNEMPSNDQLGDPLYAEVPRENCESNDVDLAYAVVPIEMNKMPKTNANIEGLHYADVELTSSKEDAQYKQDATLYADIKL